MEGDTEKPTIASAPGSLRATRDLSRGSLRKRAARGTIINGAFEVGVSALATFRGLLIAAFFSTTQYGAMGVLLVMVATIGTLRQLGIGDRFVQQDAVDQETEFHHAFTLELMVTTVFALIGAALVLGAAAAYDAPQIVGPGLVMLLAIPLTAFQLPLAVFYRRMDFARQRSLQILDPLVSFVVTIPLAATGAGLWAIAIGTLSGAVVASVAISAASPYRLRLRVSRESFGAYRDFSWPIFLGGLASVFLAQGLIGVGQATVGLAGVGIIALTSQMSQFVTRADKALTDTLYPAICAIKDRFDLMAESCLKSNRLALMWALPFGAGVALFSDDLLRYCFGEQWVPGADLLRFTVLGLAVNQIGFNWHAYYQALGNTRPFAVEAGVNMAIFAFLVLPALAIGGLYWLGVSLLGAQAILLGLRRHFLLALFPGLPLVSHALRSVMPVLPGVGAVLAARAVGADGGTAAALEAVTFIVVTGVATLLLERTLIQELSGYLRRGSGPEGGLDLFDRVTPEQVPAPHLGGPDLQP